MFLYLSRLDNRREKMRRYYTSETDDQRIKRLEKAREYKRQQKMKLEKVETAEERVERLRKQRERQRRFYARETPEQRRRRLEKVRQYQQKRKQGSSSPGPEGTDSIGMPPMGSGTISFQPSTSTLQA